jgi:hypothetical protein
MAIHQRILLAAIAFTVLGGCGGSAEHDAPAEPPPVEDTAFGELTGTMDRARGVQDTVDAQKQEMDRQLRSAEGEE